MDTAVWRVAKASTAGTEIERLREAATIAASVNYAYAIDEAGTLCGVVSIRELLQADPTRAVGELMQIDPITVSADEDQERVAHLAVAQNIKAIPVVTKEGVLLGVVNTDVILRILQEETTEDFIRLAGVDTPDTHAHKLLQASSAIQIRQRLPWLLLGLAGGMFAAILVSRFEAVLEAQVAVAAFIPLVVYLADAIGSQIQIIFIRTLTLRPHISVFGYAWREVLINVSIGLVLALLVGLLSFVWFLDVALSVALAVSVFATALTALFIAIVLPWTLHRCGKDSAIGSGPLATVLIDLLSLLIYFLVVAALLL